METFEYRGYAMRSHSETRWASMMDYLGIRWLYEPKTYRTENGGYLPDFYLPDARCFLEVKGPEPSKLEVAKAKDVQAATGMPVIFGFGSPKLDGVYLGEGYLRYEHILVTTYQVCEGLAKLFGEEYAMRFAMAGRLQRAAPCTQLGVLAQQVFDGMMGRSYIENRRREQHAPLNAVKLEQAVTVPTFATVLVAGCIERLRPGRQA